MQMWMATKVIGIFRDIGLAYELEIPNSPTDYIQEAIDNNIIRREDMTHAWYG